MGKMWKVAVCDWQQPGGARVGHPRSEGAHDGGDGGGPRVPQPSFWSGSVETIDPVFAKMECLVANHNPKTSNVQIK